MLIQFEQYNFGAEGFKSLSYPSFWVVFPFVLTLTVIFIFTVKIRSEFSVLFPVISVTMSELMFGPTLFVTFSIDNS